MFNQSLVGSAVCDPNKTWYLIKFPVVLFLKESIKKKVFFPESCPEYLIFIFFVGGQKWLRIGVVVWKMTHCGLFSNLAVLLWNLTLLFWNRAVIFWSQTILFWNWTLLFLNWTILFWNQAIFFIKSATINKFFLFFTNDYFNK